MSNTNFKAHELSNNVVINNARINRIERKVQEALDENRPSRVRIRTAAIEKDAIELLELGDNPSEIYILLGFVSQVAGIERSQRRRKFVMIGNLDLPGQMAVVSISEDKEERNESRKASNITKEEYLFPQREVFRVWAFIYLFIVSRSSSGV